MEYSIHNNVYLEMKICFLIPPEPVADQPAERTAGCTRVVYPMPNIYELTVAAVLERDGHNISYTDLTASNDTSLDEFIATSDAEVFIIWSVNLSRQADFAARDALLKSKPNAKILFLGPGATYFPHLYLVNPRVIIVRGEPDITTSELIRALSANQPWDKIEGISWLASDGTIARNPSRPLLKNLDTLPFPARHLLGNRQFHNPKLKTGPYTTMVTSRNCPFHCIYCVPSSLTFARELNYKEDNSGKKPPIAFRSVENVANEIDYLATHGYKAIGFVDDNFIWNETRTAGICEALRRNGIKWGCEARVDAITEPVAKLLGESGCAYVDLGVESFNDEILRFIRKGITSAQIESAIRLLQKYKVGVKLNILIGTSPLETKATLRETLRKAKALKVDQVMFNIISPFPGTEFYKMAKENGWIKGGDYEPTNVQRTSILNYPHLSTRDMERALFWFNLKFFLSPRIVFKHLVRFRSVGEFTSALRALYNKLFGG